MTWSNGAAAEATHRRVGRCTPRGRMGQGQAADAVDLPMRGVAAAVPVSARLDPAKIRRHWLLQRWHETPSWLASLVFHMTLVILLGSLTLSAIEGRRRLLPLLLTVAESPGAPERDLETVMEPRPIDLGAHDGPHDLAPLAVEVDAQPVDPFAPTEAEVLDDEVGATVLEQIVQETSRSAASVLLADVASMVQSGQAQPREFASLDRPPADADAVVERFILYDIGRLRGEEGEAARRAFSQLCDESIPALVRGLNRSAYISASCPVVVISRKLIASLDDAADPQSLEYAIEHLGRDVPPGAPHAGVLQQVRRKALELKDLRARYLALRDGGSDLTWHEFKQLDQLAGEKPSVLAAGLRSPNDDVRLAAAAAVGLSADDLVDRTRVRLGRDVSELLYDGDPRVRQQARVTLSRLAPEAAAELDADADPLDATRHWRAYWAQLQRTTVAAHAAENQLNMAHRLAAAGRIDSAMRRYRKLVADYPDSEAAEAAARELERHGE